MIEPQRIMRTTFKFLFVFVLAILTSQSCQDQDDVPVPEHLKINNFIWKGLNLYYLWQADVPNLADKRFANQAALNTFL